MNILCYGATGSQGAPVAQKLLAAGHNVRIATRDPSKATAFTGADIVQADMNDPASLAAASDGQEGISLHIPFFAPSPQDSLNYTQNALTAAKNAGAKLVVWNTGALLRGQTPDNPRPDVRFDILQIVQDSGIPYMVFQPTSYMENFLGPWTQKDIAENDIFAFPAPLEVKMSWLATADVGSFVSYAFAHPELVPLNLQVSGPENLNGEEVAERFSSALGRNIRFQPVLPEEFGARIDEFYPGMGASVVNIYKMAYAHPEQFSHNVDIQKTLATMPVEITSLEQWVTQHKHLFQPS